MTMFANETSPLSFCSYIDYVYEEMPIVRLVIFNDNHRHFKWCLLFLIACRRHLFFNSFSLFFFLFLFLFLLSLLLIFCKLYSDVR